ncbi:hypothetical protein C493_12704 [Natronolimnohabitans innermongolicus JCM 12255]|uniref:Uncharacterized protein n=1 Tax=Natronolimnohabitans innermongolicus JCM 12255 TaxID=1227499 RepID=L9X1L0_9EURY|nr:hypothetical protein C493_12704 [Natronolimnohabitans innermongolicus JCM 12255]
MFAVVVGEFDRLAFGQSKDRTGNGRRTVVGLPGPDFGEFDRTAGSRLGDEFVSSRNGSKGRLVPLFGEVDDLWRFGVVVVRQRTVVVVDVGIVVAVLVVRAAGEDRGSAGERAEIARAGDREEGSTSKVGARIYRGRRGHTRPLAPTDEGWIS